MSLLCFSLIHIPVYLRDNHPEYEGMIEVHVMHSANFIVYY